MTVLIIDDQLNVVEGLVSGVDFAKAGMDRVLTAYSAAQAKEILLLNSVDVMLCDIEMPGENGLSLYRWTREQHMELECIFLTAHADFAYAKTAMQLESLDYILQPARYEEVTNALLRARQKLEERREQKKFYAYGKLLFDERKTIVDQCVREWYQEDGDATRYERLKEKLYKMNIHIFDTTRVLLVLQEVSWTQEPWKKELFRYSCENILGEMLEPLGAGASFWEIAGGLYMAIVCQNKAAYMPTAQSGGPGNSGRFPTAKKTGDAEQFLAVMERFHKVASDFFGCRLTLYLGEVCEFLKSGRMIPALKWSRENNVAKKSGVFLAMESRGEKTPVKLPDFKLWENYLVQGMGKAVYDESIRYFTELSEQGEMNSSVLKRFYNEFYKRLSLVEEKTNTAYEEIFTTPEAMELALHAYESLDGMKEFLRTVTAYFNSGMETEDWSKVRINQIKDYIYRHLDTEVKREDIATALFLNPNYLSRIFKSETGISLKEFIIQEKMKMARAMLKSSLLPISIVAQKVGYGNFSHFSQAYKKTFGISPTEERSRVKDT
ncbi:MAG: response regulator [Clostridiales bacterium]|nr:response regulator [Clostridiales bacterium]